ncbi:dynamin family protein [Burkholderia vietnamiensis]|uniref:dynamin family protein n=1 Tax=Burkholderia vietnamiensis TaxID=60552 RepID=UPI001B934299|nr:dynamin family protein [Burkholderia vietnamiensis]MBR8219847.1 dynamin family protein [Burkholderia vietnamiensis]
MATLFTRELYGHIDKLAAFFVWRRRPLRDVIVAQIGEAETCHEGTNRAWQDAESRLQGLREVNEQLAATQVATQQQLEKTKTSYSALADAHRNTQEELRRACNERDEASERHGADLQRLEILQAQFEALTSSHREAQTQLQQLREERNQLVTQLASTTTALNEAQVRNAELVGVLDDVRRQQQCLEDERQQLATRHAATVQQLEEAECRHEDAAKSRENLRMQLRELDKLHTTLKRECAEQKARTHLLSRLLAARPRTSEGLATFRQLLDGDYMTFAKVGSSMKSEAAILQELQSIYRELEELTCAGDVSTRTLVGIVGGFSSGKSELINSFIDDREVRLKVGLEPVTAIPTYVVAAEERAIFAATANGGRVELDAELFGDLSSAWIGEFNFDVKAVMPSLHVAVKMDPKLFGNLCLLDTPGYNAANASRAYTASDRTTALRAISTVDTIIWVIAAEVNGTVPDSDLEFLYEAGLGTRPVYVVLSKADLRSEDELEVIMDEVEYVLKSERIVCKGISAYSSVRRTEIAYRKKSLKNHLASLNKASRKHTHLVERIASIFVSYDNAIEKDIRTVRTRESAIKSLKLDAVQVGGEELLELLLKSIEKLEIHVDVDELKKALKKSDELYGRFFDAVELALGYATEANGESIERDDVLAEDAHNPAC